MLTPPTTEDFSTLQRHFNKAFVAVKDVVWEGGYPVYPDSIPEFMEFITSSSWCDLEYLPAEAEKILDRLGSANLKEICSVLTALARSERFCDGSWLSVITNGTCAAVIRRAEEVVGGSISLGERENQLPI